MTTLKFYNSNNSRACVFHHWQNGTCHIISWRWQNKDNCDTQYNMSNRKKCHSLHQSQLHHTHTKQSQHPKKQPKSKNLFFCCFICILYFTATAFWLIKMFSLLRMVRCFECDTKYIFLVYFFVLFLHPFGLSGSVLRVCHATHFSFSTWIC